MKASKSFTEISRKSIEYACICSSDRALVRPSPSLNSTQGRWAWYIHGGPCRREDTPRSESVLLLGWKTQPLCRICMVLSFLFSDGYATRLFSSLSFSFGAHVLFYEYAMWLRSGICADAHLFSRQSPEYAGARGTNSRGKCMVDRSVRREYGEYRRYDGAR